MPCYEVNIMNLKFNVKSVSLLKEALDELGLAFTHSENRISVRTGAGRININLGYGEAELRDRDIPLLNKIKRTYSEKAIEAVAKKKKWILSKQGNKVQAKKW